MSSKVAYQRAMILVSLSRYNDAEMSLRHALSIDPTDARSHAMLAVCLVPQGKFAAARASAETAVAKDPKLAFAYYALAVTLLRDSHYQSEKPSDDLTEQPSRLDLAEENIRRAICLDPENANFHALLATVLLDRGDGEQAVDEARVALFLEPGQSDALRIISVAAGYLGATAPEIPVSVTAITNTPESAVETAAYGAIFLRAGERRRAIPLVDAALRREPDHPYVRRQYIEVARAASRIYALSARTRHHAQIIDNPYAAFYTLALTLLVGVGFMLGLFLSEKLHIKDSIELILLSGLQLPGYVLITLRAWLDFRLQFDRKAGPLLTRSQRWQANLAVWFGATLVTAQAIPLAQAAGHVRSGFYIFAVLEVAATIYFFATNYRQLPRHRAG